MKHANTVALGGIFSRLRPRKHLHHVLYRLHLRRHALHLGRFHPQLHQRRLQLTAEVLALPVPLAEAALEPANCIAQFLSLLGLHRTHIVVVSTGEHGGRSLLLRTYRHKLHLSTGLQYALQRRHG